MTMSDKIVVMRDGRIQQEGSPHELYERPRNRFVAGFIGQSNSIPGRLSSFDPADRVAHVDVGGGIVLRGRVTDDEATVSEGAELVVSIRPERLEIGRDDDRGALAPAAAASAPGPSRGWTSVPGRVRQGTYLGDQTEYRLDTPLGELVARQPHHAGLAEIGLAPGESIAVRWRDDANVVLVA